MIWASGGQQEGPDPEEARQLGVIVPDPEPLVLDMHPEAEDAIRMWFRVSTQWRVSGGHRIGLDYGVILPLLEMYEVGDRRGMLEDLQIMEAAALEAMAGVQS